MPNQLHDKVFDFCESYRAAHPGFLYWLRERNTNGKLDEGIWFQGSEKYAFVGLYDANGGPKRTRSIGLVFTNKDEGYKCTIEVGFPADEEKKKVDFYKKVVNLFGKSLVKGQNLFEIELTGNDAFTAASNFLDTIKPQIDALVEQHNLQQIFITFEKFNNKLQAIMQRRTQKQPMSEIKYQIVNITWNSNNWQGISKDKSGHGWVQQEGNIPHESWNFDIDNKRNTTEEVRGYCKFTNAPSSTKIENGNNLIIFFSRNQIVGFYGKAQILDKAIDINKRESYNLIGNKSLSLVIKNKIASVKEKGYFEDKKGVGRNGIIYPQSKDTIQAIINEAILLNPEEPKLYALGKWLNLGHLPAPNYWVFQANPSKVYRIIDALKDGLLQSWMVNQYKKEIKTGDKVILWVSGEAAGIYALATVTSPVHSAKVEEEEHKYFIDQSKTEEGTRVNLRLDYNLVDKPIFKEQVLATPQLSDLKQGTQGTNFLATQIQYDTILNIIHMDTNHQNPLNQILFGPPGTGKTYHTITESVKIVDPEYFKQYAANRNKIQERFNDLLIKDWEKPEGQISFCTFHQSFSYEDFVEGIKPLKPEKGDTSIKYDIVNGIFKKICRLADASNNAQQLAKENLVSLTQEEFNKAVFYKISLGDSTKEEDKEIYDYCINNGVIAIGFGESIDFTGKNEEQVKEVVAENKLDSFTADAINRFKTALKVGNYVTVSNGNNFVRALGKVKGEYEFKTGTDIRYTHFRKVEWIFKDVEIPVTEFYKNKLQQQTIYKLRSEDIIPEFFVRRSKLVDNSIQQKNFVLVIDEINRGNVSSVFGELITLIEPSKRSGKPEALEVVLPYSKERFTVPSNVYIIGTMNTADRSIESLDTALRRRFSFKEMEPEPKLIETVGKSKGVEDGIDIKKMLEKINERIEKLIDKDHKIGHSYFLDVVNAKDLELAFKDKVIPLLEEYFFGDFGKIGLVLGNSFIKKEEIADFDFAVFADYDAQTEQDLKQRPVFKIQPVDKWEYKSIYQPKSKT